MEYKNETDFWELLDKAPNFAKCASNLIHWSTNYSFSDKSNPLPIFLTLIGYNAEELGEEEGKAYPMGWVEMGYLASALDEYSNAPQDVYDFVKFALELDGNK